MCRNELKRAIRDAIIFEEIKRNGWTPSMVQYQAAYIDVFTKSYPQGSLVERATITLRLDAHGDIRCYPHLTFRQRPDANWRADFYERYGNEEIAGMRLEQAQQNGVMAGIAINAILQDQSWRNWTLEHLPQGVIDTLRECCARLREWTDRYAEARH